MGSPFKSFAAVGSCSAAALLLGAMPANSDAAVVFGSPGAPISGGFRWDAAPRIISGRERSLDGGLRYSLQGGSYQAFRDLFTWDVLPSVALFQQTVEEAFNAWTVTDPATGLTTSITFVADFATPVVGTGAGGVNIAGAEIDLFGSIDANSWNPGDPGTRGESFFNAVGGTVTLTSGTVGYAAGAISGADVTLNSNPQAVYSIDVFRLLLSHELGHALGLGDVEGSINPNQFIDDNYDNTSSATALATLTNSWAALVDPLNPAASPLTKFQVNFGNPGTTTPGVNILMESNGLGGQFGNLTPLTNDDYGGRQFLYPSINLLAVIPEPSSLSLLALSGLMLRRRRGR